MLKGTLELYMLKIHMVHCIPHKSSRYGYGWTFFKRNIFQRKYVCALVGLHIYIYIYILEEKTMGTKNLMKITKNETEREAEQQG